MTRHGSRQPCTPKRLRTNPFSSPQRGEGLVESSRVHQGHLALNGSRPCSIPGECLRQGQRREGPSASSADGSKVRTVVLRRITGTTAWTLCIFSARVLASTVARDLALHRGCEQCDA